MSEISQLKRNEEAWELVKKSDDLKQENLESEAHYDEMNAEQTWPTEQELQEGIENKYL
jgi:hypothetical protein